MVAPWISFLLSASCLMADLFPCLRYCILSAVYGNGQSSLFTCGKAFGAQLKTVDELGPNNLAWSAEGLANGGISCKWVAA